MNLIPTSMPWWRSRVIMGAVVSIASKALYASGVIGQLAPEEEAQIADAVVLLIGAIGDLVAIGARIRQRHVPAITGS